MSAFDDLTDKQKEAVLDLRDRGYARLDELPFQRNTMDSLVDKGFATVRYEHAAEDTDGEGEPVYSDYSRSQEALYEVDSTSVVSERHVVKALNADHAEDELAAGRFVSFQDLGADHRDVVGVTEVTSG